MAVTKLGIYNDALILLGQRVLSTDTEDRPNRHKLDALYDNGAVDYCLEIVKPRFATKLTTLTGVSPTLTTAYTSEATLPSTFQALIGVYVDKYMDQPVKRFTHEEDKILSDFASIHVRFVQDFTTVGLTNMSSAFARVISAYLARELSVSIDPDETENMDTQLETRIAISQENDTNTEDVDRALTASVALSASYFNIFNDALQILKLPRLASTTDDSLRRNALDVALASELVEAVLEDTNWGFGMESKKLTYNASYAPDFGPSYGHDVPSDVHRIDGVWADDFRRTPVIDYVQEYLASAGNDVIYTDYQIIYIQFVSSDFISDPTLWPSYFKRLVAAQLAFDAGGQIPGADVLRAENILRMRKSEALSTDAIVSPPRRLSEGSWAGSRSWGGSRNNRNRP